METPKFGQFVARVFLVSSLLLSGCSIKKEPSTQFYENLQTPGPYPTPNLQIKLDQIGQRSFELKIDESSLITTVVLSQLNNLPPPIKWGCVEALSNKKLSFQWSDPETTRAYISLGYTDFTEKEKTVVVTGPTFDQEILDEIQSFIPTKVLHNFYEKYPYYSFSDLLQIFIINHELIHACADQRRSLNKEESITVLRNIGLKVPSDYILEYVSNKGFVIEINYRDNQNTKKTFNLIGLEELATLFINFLSLTQDIDRDDPIYQIFYFLTKNSMSYNAEFIFNVLLLSVEKNPELLNQIIQAKTNGDVISFIEIIRNSFYKALESGLIQLKIDGEKSDINLSEELIDLSLRQILGEITINPVELESKFLKPKDSSNKSSPKPKKIGKENNLLFLNPRGIGTSPGKSRRYYGPKKYDRRSHYFF